MQNSEIASFNHELIDKLESFYCFFQSLKMEPTVYSFKREEKTLIEEQDYILIANGFTENHFDDFYFHNIQMFRKEQGDPSLRKVFINILKRQQSILTSVLSYFEIRYATLENQDNELLKQYYRILKETLKTSQNYREKLVL